MPIVAFFAVTFLPTTLLIAATFFGGAWIAATLFCLTLLNGLVDAVWSDVEENPSDTRWKTGLPVLLALIHFPLLGCVVYVLASQGLAPLERIGLFAAAGIYFGTVSNAVGHELIHRGQRLSFRLGKWLFISHLFGHHTSAHRLIHHRFVASPYDPNTARFNESFYRYFRRAWRGSFRAGLAAELRMRGLPEDSRQIALSHPYFTYICGALAFLGLAAGMAGLPGIIAYLGLALMAQAGLLLTDYVQHYGLARIEFDDGRLEPVGPAHSWNAPHWFTRKLTLNAPLHSDHHANPSKPFTALVTPQGAPTMPYSPGIMTMIALWPRVWRKLMNPRVAALAMASRVREGHAA
ncbi:MAG: alkane 1-monooxygenase [Pseudomonadota bacterium]